MFNPRPRQAEILTYEAGRMGIPAVPGSGKTHTLSYLASLLITKGFVAEDQEILIVTLVNSAVDNFANRVSRFIQQAGLLQKMGYRVRTLHGLAHDIIRERPELAGVSEVFSILDENKCRSMVEQISAAYLREHPEMADLYLDPAFELEKDYRNQQRWKGLFADIATSYINQAKDLQLDPQELRARLHQMGTMNPLLDFGMEVFTEYQRGLRFRNALDFSDLTRLAIRALDSDADFLTRLQHRWPYILEDEAQDSSAIQEAILRKLAGVNGNWVRVGDSNQAIFDSFTTANPEFLQRFLQEPGVVRKDLPNSGRSNQSIINMANHLIQWTNQEHPVPALRNALSLPYIEPAPPGDPQPNPPDRPEAIYIHPKSLNPEDEISIVVRSIEKWLGDSTDKTVAVLCPIGKFAQQVVEALQQTDIKVVELLHSSNRTRKVVQLIERCLGSIADPSNIAKFNSAFDAFKQFDEDRPAEDAQFDAILTRIRKVRQLENLIYPQVIYGDGDREPVTDVLSSSKPLQNFLAFLRRWHAAAPLPIDQLILVIGNDLFTKPQDLALTHKLSLMLESVARSHPEYRLAQFILELKEISSNQRKFEGFSDSDTGFNPEAHKGKVLVTTYHKAKGLEWDRVYLMSVNNYDFPSLQEFDQYKSEKWFVRGKINLEAELLSMLKQVASGETQGLDQNFGAATLLSRQQYAAERLRLFFVGITRARESLIITWNTGMQKNCTESLPLQAMEAYRKELSNAAP